MAADGGLRGWLRLIARLYARGHAMTPQALFAGRDCRCIDLESKFPAAPADPGWRLDAGRIRPVVASAAARLGRAPLLDLDSAAATPVVDINHCDIQGLSPGERVAYAAYLDYERSMQRFLEQQELAVGQLLALCTEAQSRAETQLERPAEPAAPPARSVDLPRTPVNPPLTAAAVSDCLVAIISDHTGYPADAIGLEMDLEGDLGIDSIKRVEIAVALQERLPAAVAAGLKGRLETLTTRRTVAAMASACEPYLQLGPPLEESPPETPLAEDSLAALAQSTAPPQPCPRSLPQCVPVMLPIRRRERLSGLFLVTEDALGIAAPLLGLLRARGAAAYPLSIADLDSDRALDRRHGVLRQRHGPVRGVLHLAALGRDQADTLSDWRRCTELACKRLLRLLQLSVGDFERAAEPPLVIAASGLGGNFGRGSDNLGAVAAGGQHGLLRTLVREYPAVQARSVDLDQALAPTAAAALLLEEVLADDGEPEVGYPGGRRQAIRYVAAPLAAPVAGATGATDWEPQPGWIILATGGARGITAATLAGLPLDGVRLILVGRGPAPMVGEPTDAEAIEALRQDLSAEAEAIEALRQGLSAELRSGAGRAAEELQAEIARSDVELRRCRRDLACHSALERLRRAGADLEYHAVDCRDEAAFGGLIEDIYRRFGRIDAVLHGAGVIEDQRLARKSAQSFSRVFDTKADGLYLLARYLRPEGLRWLVCFSSVSGRYGNPGQADYAAANEVLNRACWVLRQRWPSTRIAAINWGPWATLGMADDAVLQLLAGRGIESITPAQGCAFFATELGVGDPTEVEVIAGQGPWTEGLDIDQGLAQLIAQIGMAMRTPAPC
jgi:NAD(P)-dependent dehydrogenase (short-subunit alcohol dehydrogenase family)/acyl carrier protein